MSISIITTFGILGIVIFLLGTYIERARTYKEYNKLITGLLILLIVLNIILALAVFNA